MIHYLVPTRAYKRLIYFVFLWTCVCFVVFRFATNYQSDGGVDYADGHAAQVRGLLQKVPLDYAPGFLVTTTTSRTTTSGSKIDDTLDNKFLNIEPQVDNSPSLSGK